MALAHSPKIVTSGLVLCLDAANLKSYPGSGTTWTDLSGNGNTGTLTNGPTFNSGNGGSIVFDGTNDRIVVPRSLSIEPQNISILIWLKINNTSLNHQIIRKQVSGGNGYDIRFEIGGGIRFWINVNNNWQNIQINRNDISINNFQYLVCTFESNIAKMYLNTTLKVEQNFNGLLTYDNVSDLYIGGSIYDGNYILNGNIAQIQIYNRALTATEIQQNFQALRGRYGI